jgi:hypothetical protein
MVYAAYRHTEWPACPSGYRKEVGPVAPRIGSLLVPVTGLSGTTYPPGTTVVTSGRGSSVDAFVGGDWLPLAWWEFTEGVDEQAAEGGPAGGP